MMRVVFLVLVFYLVSGEGYVFPDGFRFGVSTSSYQIEGAWNVLDKGESIWDTFTHDHPELIADGSNGDVACDAYHRTVEDVQILKSLGVHYYRFSISWPRILPTGKTDYINPDGIRYYNELIDELLDNDIQPMVTMFHFDLPQALEDEGGFLNETLVDYFEDYADLLYRTFGDRVKEWITFNEPYMTCAWGYGDGSLAPGVKMAGVGCYICGRTLLLAHARAYHLYNNTYREEQGGTVAISLNRGWYEPLDSDNVEDVEVNELAMQINLGWYAHPIFSETGDYPQIMKDRIADLSTQEGFTKSRLPEFTQEEIDYILGTSDYLGFNHYSAELCTVQGENEYPRPSIEYDTGVSCTSDPNWEIGASWIYVVPWGFRKVLVWIKDNYNNPEVVITENGYGNNQINIDDCRRINYYNLYLEAMLEAIVEDGCNITGYTAWSFMDNFEWTNGYTVKFGLVSVDFDDVNKTRTPKMSSYAYGNVIKTGAIDWSYTPDGFDSCEW